MFHLKRLSSRCVASVVASTSAVGALAYREKFTMCEEFTAKKSAKKNDLSDDFQLFHAYEVYFGHNEKKPISKAEMTEILLGCGILDPTICDFLFNSLVAMDMKRSLKKSKRSKPDAKVEVEKVEGVDEPIEPAEPKVSYQSFHKLCNVFFKGEDLAKWEIMFDFMDHDKTGMADKNEISVALRHLLWCQTNWYGEEILYDGPFDLDLYFDVPTEAIAQLKANKLAHELVMSSHGAGRQSAVTTKQFMHWMRTGGKQVEMVKGLFSIFGAYDPPEFNKYDE